MGTSAVQVTVSGSVIGSSVTLKFNAPGFDTAVFTGRLASATEMDGIVNGSGFTQMPLTLLRR